MSRPALMLALAALAAQAAAPGLALAQAPSQSRVDRRVDAVAAQLRCPVCQNLSVRDSPSDVAASLRARIRDLVLAGRSDAQIKAFFVARYGNWILLSPPRRGIGLAVWLAPLLLLSAGLATVMVAVRRWTARARQLDEVAAQRPEAMARARAALVAAERREDAA